ncbi:MAG: PEP-CTERM sorting domain-containing protein [Fimbriimonadaceae bacterium]
MKRRAIFRGVSVLGAAVVAMAAHAQFVVSGPGPFASVGDFGTPANGRLTAVGNADAIYSTFSFSGRLTSRTPLTYASDAHWNMLNTTTGGWDVFFAPFVEDEFTVLDANVSAPGMFWVRAGNQYEFEAWEEFDDNPGGADAEWTNVEFRFSGSVAPILTLTVQLNEALAFDTFGSDFDTELALFSDIGELIAANDDANGTLQSQIQVGPLGLGTYYLLASGFDAIFQREVAVAGDGEGDLLVNLNGANIVDRFHPEFSLSIVEVQVVPEPATLAVLGIGALAAMRRRRRS